MMISKGIFSFGLCCCCCCCCCIKIVYMYLVRCARVLALEQICEKLYVCIWNADMNMRSNARNIYIIDWQKKNTAHNNWESPNKGRKHSGERARTVWSDFGCARILFFSLQFNPIESWAHCGSFSLSLWVCMRIRNSRKRLERLFHSWIGSCCRRCGRRHRRRRRTHTMDHLHVIVCAQNVSHIHKTCKTWNALFSLVNVVLVFVLFWRQIH